MSRHGFFHSMVIVGGGLAVGCGGATTGQGGDSSAAGGTDAIGQGGAPGGGVAMGSGGTAQGGTGGIVASSGGSAGSAIPPPSTGGAMATGGAPMGIGGNSLEPEPEPEPLAFYCQSEQVDCGDPADFLLDVCEPSTVPLTIITHSCACDETRPASPEDCAVDERMVCMRATHDLDYDPLPEPLPFQCSCQPGGGECQEYCNTVFPGPGTECRGDGEMVLCGCSLIVLR